MSGRQQHYLPCFLQRPFAYRQKGDQFYVHAHHRVRGRFPTNVKGLGKELDFYSDPTDTSLDDAITRTEDALGETVAALNRDGTAPPIEVATLICALSFRTKSMRKALTDFFPLILEAGRSRLLDDSRLRTTLRESLHDPQKRKKLIYEQMRKTMGHMSREKQARLYAALLPRWKSFVEENEEKFMAQGRSLIRLLLDRAMEEANAIADSGYLKALAQDPDMPIRARRMATEMRFDVWDASPGEFFILGDCGPVAHFTDGRARLALTAISDDVQMELVFLPISPSRCIVGRRPAAQLDASTMDINRDSAALSHEFFVSHLEEGDPLIELRESIGSMVPIETEEDIFLAINEDPESPSGPG